MKKTTSLLAIVGLLLLSVSLLSNASAEAPAFPEVPDVKLITGTGLTPAFDLADYNTGDAATAYNIVTNFLGLSSLSGSEVNYASYGAATVGDNVYSGSNEGGTGNAQNKLKFSTYRINKLPKVGLNPGDSVNVAVGSYVSPASPPSFGNADALIVSDTTQVDAIWADANTVTITALAGATGPVNVDVIAAPISSGPYGVDIDKERIEVCINLLPNSTFSTAADTAAWAYEAAPGRSTLVAPTHSAGAITFTFTDANGGVKATPSAGNRVAYAAGQWYTARALASGNAGNSHQFLLFNFSDIVAVGGHVDVAANVLLGTPDSATWIEAPVYSNETGTGFPQYQLKAGGAGSITIEEIQLLNCAPTLIDANRLTTRYKYAGGDWDVGSDTTQWGKQGYSITGGETGAPGLSVANGLLTLSFAGAGSGTAQRGIKWTASTTGDAGGIISPANTVGRQVGVKAELTTDAAANFDSLSSVILLALYGSQTNGGSTLVTGTELIASAEFGRITNGAHYAVANSVTGYHQFQFGLKNDQAGSIDVDNVDLLIDKDDPDYGDDVLFP